MRMTVAGDRDGRILLSGMGAIVALCLSLPRLRTHLRSRANGGSCVERLPVPPIVRRAEPAESWILLMQYATAV